MSSEAVANFVNLVFLMIINWGNPRIQVATIIWVGSDATSWVKHMEGTKGQVRLEKHC